MANETQREQVIEQVVTRLQEIDGTGSFRTDVGQTVFIGEVPQLGEDDPEKAIAVLVGDTELVAQKETVSEMLPIQIFAVTKVGNRDGWRRVEAVLGDIKRAIELDGRRIEEGNDRSPELRRGPTVTLKLEPGSTVMGAGVTYTVQIVEGWGQP